MRVVSYQIREGAPLIVGVSWMGMDAGLGPWTTISNRNAPVPGPAQKYLIPHSLASAAISTQKAFCCSV